MDSSESTTRTPEKQIKVLQHQLEAFRKVVRRNASTIHAALVRSSGRSGTYRLMADKQWQEAMEACAGLKDMAGPLE